MVIKMLEQILQKESKITKEVKTISLLMNHYHNQDLKNKWQFTYQTYQNLLSNLHQKDITKAVENCIINDYETLNLMLSELKEDLNHSFSANAWLLLNSFTIYELEEFARFEEIILIRYATFTDYIKNINKEYLKPFQQMIIALINNLEKTVKPTDVKFIPFNKLATFSKITDLNVNVFISSYQAVTTARKYLVDKNFFKDEYLEFKMITLVMLIGDKNV